MSKHTHTVWSVEVKVHRKDTYSDSPETHVGHYHTTIDGAATLPSAINMALDSLYARWPEIEAQLRPLRKHRRKAAMVATKRPKGTP